jgi:cytochrome c biogenesis protein CcdA
MLAAPTQLAAARELLGWTRGETGAKVGRSGHMVGQAERGKAGSTFMTAWWPCTKPRASSSCFMASGTGFVEGL